MTLTSVSRSSRSTDYCSKSSRELSAEIRRESRTGPVPFNALRLSLPHDPSRPGQHFSHAPRR
eukprot:909240-Prymnesium_polylepis.1